MPPKGGLPACGFSVTGTKKGELPLKVEKRARGKKVTVIPNVQGDATKLAKALMGILGVGGTVRQADKGSLSVEVQGDQTARVTQELLNFGCLQGMTKPALDALRKERETSGKGELVVDRTTATKYLAQTQTGGKMSPEEERKKALHQEAEFYGQFWQAFSVPPGVVEDFSDIWEDALTDEKRAEQRAQERPPPQQTLAELNVALSHPALYMLAEVGRAVKEFWDKTGFTVAQFRKMALSPGARLIDEAPGRRQVPSNLRSRQKVSDFKSRSGGSRGGHYFSVTCRAYDNYQRGVGPEQEEPAKPEEPKMKVDVDEDGWNTAVLSYVVPFPVPASRLEDEERSTVSKSALRLLEAELAEDLSRGLHEKVPGVECQLDCSTFGVDLHVLEQDFLHAPRKDNGKSPTQQDKEEMKLEKKLREICSLRKKQVDGVKLEKLQAEKVLRKVELFTEVAELKLRRAEKELLRVFKRYIERFKDAFWDLEWKALYGDESPNDGVSDQNGTFDAASCQGSVVVSRDGFHAETQSATWVGCLLHLCVRDAEVGAFAIEVLDGLLRLGWAASASSTADLGADHRSFGFGATGKKVTGGVFDPYGQSFKAGDVIHCEAERENGRLRIGFAKNNEPLGVAFDTTDMLGPQEGLFGAVCGKGFKVRLISAESMPLDEAPGLDGFQEFDPPRQVTVLRDFHDDSEEAESCLQLWKNEMLYVSSDDGEGWLFGFYLDPEDPDDGGWFPADAVQFLDEVEEGGIEIVDSAVSSTTATPQAFAGPVDEEVCGHCQRKASRDSGDEYDGVWYCRECWDTWPADDAAAAPQTVDAREFTECGKQAAQLPNERTTNGYAHNTPSAVKSSSPPDPSVPDLSPIEGLEDWLSSLSLLKYADRALAWCDEMGAVDVQEVKDNWEDFAEALGLKNLEKKRMQKNL